MRSTPSDLHAVDIGAEIQFGGRDAVAAAVTREKSYLVTFELTNDIVIGRRAKRSFHRDFALAGESPAWSRDRCRR